MAGADSVGPARTAGVKRRRRPWLRRPIRLPVAAACSLLAICTVLAIWWFLTWGEAESRIYGPTKLPNPSETFQKIPSLLDKNEGNLTQNTLVTLKRVTVGFSLAFVVGVPLGILASCFSPVRAFLAPLVIFGRNVPIAALIPLTFFFFGIGERQKVMFIFIACVAFIIADVTVAISDVSSRYLDTAYTLGANTWQAIIKVLVPLAMPSILDSARLLFGLAFGYIMLAELVKLGDEAGGLGNLILVSQKRGQLEFIYLIVLLIPILALLIDRLLYWIQRELFPHRYGGNGGLNEVLRMALHAWDDVKSLIWKPKPPFDQLTLPDQDEPQ